MARTNSPITLTEEGIMSKTIRRPSTKNPREHYPSKKARKVQKRSERKSTRQSLKAYR